MTVETAGVFPLPGAERLVHVPPELTPASARLKLAPELSKDDEDRNWAPHASLSERSGEGDSRYATRRACVTSR
jgi:hypothetical protein